MLYDIRSQQSPRPRSHLPLPEEGTLPDLQIFKNTFCIPATRLTAFSRAEICWLGTYLDRVGVLVLVATVELLVGFEQRMGWVLVGAELVDLSAMCFILRGVNLFASAMKAKLQSAIESNRISQ